MIVQYVRLIVIQIRMLSNAENMSDFQIIWEHIVT
jgi:hypothetical protein